MTTGTVGSNAWLPPQNPGGYTAQTAEYETWHGDDGKYVVIDGFDRIKYNAYTKTKISRHRTRLSNKFFVDNGYNMSGYLHDVNDEIKLMNKVFSKVNQHELQLGVAVAEGAKTIRLVRDSILSVGGALVEVKHGNFQRAMQKLGIVKSTYGRARSGKFYTNKNTQLSPEDISSRWLELQYGWKPLLKDVYEVCKAYEAITQGPRMYYFKANTKRFVNFDSSNHPSYVCPTRGKLTQKILLEMREDMMSSKPRSLGLEDPLTVAWELVPYSFVVDWFIPIGSYLAAAHSVPQLTGRWYKTAVREFVNTHCQIINPLYYEGATIDGEWLYITRTSGVGNLDVPLPKFKSLDQALSPLHVTNAIALVTSRLGRSSYNYT